MTALDTSSEFQEVIRIGVSACLLGHKVRFDGGHKRSRFIADTLADHFEFVPFCPETAIGLGTPRPPIRLVGKAGYPRAVGVNNPALDVSRQLRDYADKVAGSIDALSGFILKKDSPSCGMERVKVYGERGMPERVGRGLFAERIMASHPLLPVEEEGRLNDADLRDNFIARVYVYARWQRMLNDGLAKNTLIEFHARHKFLVMAHSTLMYSELGRLLADLHAEPLEHIAGKYIAGLMRTLSAPAPRKRHCNVLQHLLGYLKKHLDAVQKQDIVATIDAYRRGEFPLVVPVKLLQHHFRMFPHPYVARQVYLNPHPQRLKLRNAL